MSKEIKIIFPTDFSEHAVNAFESAQFLARTYDAKVVVLHVLEAPAGPARLFGFDEKEARKKASLMIDEFIKKYGDPALSFDKMVKLGKPYRQIVMAANDISANAIVMGTHGSSGIREVLAGSNASKVIRSAPCPVITIREKPGHSGFKKILLPLDLTQETGEKVQLAIEFAENFGGELVLLTVLMTEDAEVKKKLTKRMGLALKRIKEHNVPVSTAMIHSKGNIAEVIIEFGKESECDLICIMTQQEKNFKELFLGSSAGHLVNHSPIPVLAIKPVKEYRQHQFSSAHFG